MTTTEHEQTETENTEQEPQEAAQEAVETPEAPVDTEADSGAAEDVPETFPRSYVEELRQENGKYRQRAQKTDELAQRLHTSLVAATGRLADPSDLDYAEDHLDDEEALTAAVDELLARKPHLAARKPRGDVGQGITSGSSDTVDLAGLLRSRAS